MILQCNFVRKKSLAAMKILAMSVLCLTFITACGGREDGQPEGGQFPVGGAEGQQMDVVLDGNDFPDVATELDGGTFLGMQFHKGEPVQLWASSQRGDNAVSIYLYRKDGTREIVAENVSRDDTMSGGYLDGQGNYYGIAENKITKTDASGQVLISAVAGEAREHDYIEEICSAPDGKTALLARIADPETHVIAMTLMELGQDGKLTKVEVKGAGKSSYGNLPSLAAHLGTWGEDLLLMDGDYIYKIDLQTGTLTQAVSLTQTSYVAQQYAPMASQEDIKAVYIPESGRIELLWAYSSGKGRCENLTFKDMTKERETITLSGLRIDSWLKEQVAKFNSANDRYYISIKTVSDNRDAYDFRINTGIEIATGKGPELLYGEYMLESVSGMIEKGALLDLAPLMEQSRIKEEDYFPMTFRWRTGDAIYGIFYMAFAKDYLIRADVLGDVRDPDMETLLDALLAYPEKACFWGGGSSSKNILRDLLYASDTLYGMLDWEAGACDFSGRLLPKMLEVAKRYQFSPSKTQVTKIRGNYQTYVFHTNEEYEAEGYVPVYYIFDDGIHPAVDSSRDCTLCINANSAHPEAAWEFLRFILSEEAQETIYTGEPTNTNLPVMKKFFLSGGQDFIENGWSGARPVGYEATRESVDAQAKYLEGARELSWKTEPIVEIIVEEASAYFSGSKDIQQVLDMVQNRVQLYMDERGGR